MDFISEINSAINSIVWGPIMLVLILGVGLFLSIGLKFMQLSKTGMAFRLLFSKSSEGKGEIPPWQALMTAMAATVGTGNIAGVATAVFMGGPGALFWMWVIALVGMATKFAEAVLAVNFREVDAKGEYIGGPMYYIKNGLGKNWKWLGTLFAIFAVLASFGIGNGTQVNSITSSLENSFGFNQMFVAIVVAVLVGAVILGGITRIGKVAGALVPFMAVIYIIAGLLVIVIFIGDIPAAVGTIVTSAFTGHAAEGGFAGAAVWMAIRFGVARGVFSNEAGLGSAPIAHASAKTNSPVRQGLIAMLGTFMDTLIICSITGLAIVASGAWTSGVSGAALTASAFELALPGVGGYIVSISLAIFAFTTVIGWSVYGVKSAIYLFGDNAVIPYKILWVLAIPFWIFMTKNLAANDAISLIWGISDTLNAMMAIPNLIALALLSPVVFKLTKEYFRNQ